MTNGRRSVSLSLTLAFSVLVVDCASPNSTAPGANDPSPETAEQAHITAIHKAKCGACHARVEPGTRSRAVLDAAMKRHHSRMKLSSGEWAELVDYLAADGTSHAHSVGETR